MSLRTITGILATLFLCLAAVPASATDTKNPAFWKHHVTGDYAETLDSLRTGLEAHQFTITGENDLSGALERNKEALGMDKWNTIGFENVRAISFCSVLFNLNSINTDIDLAILCPFKLVIYNTRQAPREITVITVRPSYLVQHESSAKAKEMGEQMEQRIITAIKAGTEPF